MIAYLAGVATVLVPVLIARHRSRQLPTWRVRFEHGGQVYTYRRTAADMRAILTERHEVRGSWPVEVLPHWPE